MSYLDVNGMAIPVLANSDAMTSEVIGGTGIRAHSGRRLQTRRDDARVWRNETRTKIKEWVDAFRSLLQGHGDVWPFDSDLLSGKGRSPTGATTDEATIRSTTAADGAPVIGEAKYDGGAVYVDGHTDITNVSTIRDTDGTSGSWTAVNGTTIADEASHAWVGSGSISLLFPSAVDTLRAQAWANLKTDAATSTDYVVSCYVKKLAGSGDVRLQLWDATNGLFSAAEIATPISGEWLRIENAVRTTGGSGPVTLRILLEEDTIDSGLKIAVDGIQLEQRFYSTSYQDTTRDAGKLIYPATYLQKATAGLTISFWTNGPELLQPVQAHALALGPTENSAQIQIHNGGAGVNSLRFVTTGADGTLDTLAALSLWDGAIKHIVCVLRQKPDSPSPPSGPGNKEIWDDGVLAISRGLAASAMPDVSDIALAMVGGFNFGAGTSEPWGGLIDDLQILPWAASPEMIAAWAGLSEAVPPLPALRASGDFTNDQSVLVDGEFVQSTGQAFAEAGVWKNNAERVTFALHEILGA